jgi:tRNA A37 threonylcarbamoyladenosine modification protein TsaB
VVTYIDARRGNAFIALFEQREGQLSYLCEDVHQSMEAFLQTIDTSYELVDQGKPKAEKIIRSSLLHKVEDINELQPNYLRMTEAERKQQKNA